MRRAATRISQALAVGVSASILLGACAGHRSPLPATASTSPTISLPPFPAQPPCVNSDIERKGLNETLDPQEAFYHYEHLTVHTIGVLPDGRPYQAWAGAEDQDVERGLLLVSIELVNPCDLDQVQNANPTPTEYPWPSAVGPIIQIAGFDDILTLTTSSGAEGKFSVGGGRYIP